MDTQDFTKQLIYAQDLIKEEKYKKAIVLLEKLKEIEKKGDFDHNLTHKLYQLISNSLSLYNQQIILKHINEMAKQTSSIAIKELNKIISDELNIDDEILRREIELLILRGLLSCKIEGTEIIF